ncbi:hypothetical protein Ahy_A09g045371 [Arachis hypogaea]|uniref:PB1-like domain-containing protein n=1 Tax=Arachis hypogaea TaxID=3818 RepID=A0A445BM78_ARAHY|nr:hypothetical protein Ahy_A09g045371 [Arachis hypogaea]
MFRLRAFVMEGSPMTFVFHHGGKFKKDESGYLFYEPDNTEVLMGVKADTLDVFFVKGYYKELGYAEMNNCLWKVPETLSDNGLRRLENDVDLLALVKDCRRNHHLINIYFEHVVSKPHVVDCMSEDDDDSNLWTKPQAAKVSAKPTPANKINKKVKDTSKTRSRRQVKTTPVDNDSDSHDSYESAENSLYKPPKVVGDSIYSSDSDSRVDGGQSFRTKKVDHKEKHRPAADKARDKAIDTDDSSYEDSKDSDQELDFEDEDSVVHLHPRNILWLPLEIILFNGGRNIRFSKNDKVRVRAVCKSEDCPWVVYCKVARTGPVK